MTTATGLVVAVPTLLIYQYLSTKVEGLIDYIDETGTAFIVDYARLDVPTEVAAAAAQVTEAPPSDYSIRPEEVAKA